MDAKEDGNQVKGPQRVAVVIPCRNMRREISSTVRACRAIPAVDLIVVVDDGSDDNTAQIARSAGAVAVRHSEPRGRASAMETGVKVAAMRDRADWPPRLILFLQPDVGESAVEATALVESVIGGVADCAIGVNVEDVEKKRSRVDLLAWGQLRAITGWEAAMPLSTQRCLSREAIDAVMPFTSGYGVDLAITIDLIVKGFTVIEIPCNFQFSSKTYERRKKRVVRRFWDNWFTSQTRKLTRAIVPVRERTPVSEQRVGRSYRRKGS